MSLSLAFSNEINVFPLEVDVNSTEMHAWACQILHVYVTKPQELKWIVCQMLLAKAVTISLVGSIN